MKRLSRKEIRANFERAGFIEGEKIDQLIFQNKGYDLDEGHQDFKKFERSNYRTNDGKGRYGFDLRAITRLNNRVWFFQVAMYGQEFNDMVESGYFLEPFGDNGPQWVENKLFQAIKTNSVFQVDFGQFELRRIPLDDGGETLGPQVVIWHPSCISIVDMKSAAPDRPDIAAKKKETNRVNKVKNARPVTKAKAKGGKSIKDAF